MGGPRPLVIVPTRYYSTPTEEYRKAGISTVIWANHLVRAAVGAMQSVAKEILESQTLVNVEDRIVPVNEIFRLQDAEEYSAAERLYLSASGTSRAAVILAASRGRGLEAITTDRPKVMLPIAGKPLLRWLVDGLKKESINDITVVGGYRADAIDTAVGYRSTRGTERRASWRRWPAPWKASSRTPSFPTAICCFAAMCCAICSRARRISR